MNTITALGGVKMMTYIKNVETLDTIMGYCCAAASITTEKGTSRLIQVNVCKCIWLHSYIFPGAPKSLNPPLDRRTYFKTEKAYTQNYTKSRKQLLLNINTLVCPNLYWLWSISKDPNSFSAPFLLSMNWPSGMAAGFRIRYLLLHIYK